MLHRKTLASFELVVAALLWGFGFIAAVWALTDIGPFTLTAVRFGLAAAVMLPVVFLVPQLRLNLSRNQAFLAFLPGLFLMLTLMLQTWGLQYTTATKSGFITTLYVLLVPLFERWLLRRPLAQGHWFFAGLAILGTALICDFHGGDWNRGDLLTLLCAFAASLHILWFGVIAHRIGSAITFNFWQTVWAFLLVLPFASLESGPWLPASNLAWVGLLTLSFGSTLVAFALQIRAQKDLSPSISSLLYLLESPFAAMLAIALLHETLKPTQWLGAALILIPVAIATWRAHNSGSPPTSHTAQG